MVKKGGSFVRAAPQIPHSSNQVLSALNDLVQCPKCGKAVPVGKLDAEISEIGVTDHNVGFVVRRFRPMCPDCGPFIHDRVGHHGTITKKQMAHLFPKRQRGRVRDILPKNEQRDFMRTLAGKREPKNREVERWLKCLAQVMSVAHQGKQDKPKHH